MNNSDLKLEKLLLQLTEAQARLDAVCANVRNYLESSDAERTEARTRLLQAIGYEGHIPAAPIPAAQATIPNAKQLGEYLWFITAFLNDDCDPMEVQAKAKVEQIAKELMAQEEAPAAQAVIGNFDAGTPMQPLYFVKHPDETYSVADPQPTLQPVAEVLPASDEVCPVCNGIFPIGEFNILAMVHKPCGALIKEWRDDPEQKCVVCGAPPAAQVVAGQHADDVAVDRFAEAMKAKMAASRAKGRGGWESTEVCPPGSLQRMLLDHLAKGDPVDVGNFAMMIFNRGESTAAQPVDVVRDAERFRTMCKIAFDSDPALCAAAETLPEVKSADELRAQLDEVAMLAAQQQKGDK